MKFIAAVCGRSSAYTYDIFYRVRPACMFLERALTYFALYSHLGKERS
jgi:hypothetical protein